ncbi:MAG: sugar MFS transporter, partial [Ignavibacteria bacterium]|nr:sugar MFS transporter [Actinomycetota bacterium]MBM4170469.1 sugar MFS transporter [Ignavibacteria bacterium]
MASTTPTVNNTSFSNGQQNYSFALSILTSLFFMWGFITC